LSVEVRQSMNQAEQWARIAIPASIQRLWPGAKIYRVEDQQHPACKLLDTACGIDWLVEYKGLVKGLSVRCQAQRTYTYCMSQWGVPTFTIRNQRIGQGYVFDSELSKTIEAEQRGAITAAYQLHAYMDVDRGDATSAVAWGLARRVALFRWAKDNLAECHDRSTEDIGRGQQQTFIAVPFNILPRTVLVSAYPVNPSNQGYDTLRTIAGQPPKRS
jgi:hypothetical protein